MNQVKLTYQEFLEAVLEEIKERLGEEYTIQLNTILKNNSISMDGIIILKNGAKITPNIYLEEYYQQYEKEGETEKIVDAILFEYFHKISDKEDINIQFTLENMKDRIVFRVVNRDKNTELLKECPYIETLDLALTFHCLVQDGEESIGTIRITNEHMKQWNVGISELYEYAKKNTPRLLPPLLRKMEDVLKELLEVEKSGIDSDQFSADVKQLEDEVCEEAGESNAMYVLTNTKGINGASCLLYPEIIRNFSKLLKSDLYILPSSIHEIILLPACGFYRKDQLEDMVEDINHTQVPEDEVLSNHVYLYSMKENRLKLI